MRPVVCIVGPTASGKTGAALAMADYFRMEIVSADSMQVYRGMDIGTAKPLSAELERVRHHMISLVPPSEEMSVARFAEGAVACCDSCLERGNLPFLVGGTGLYVSAILQNRCYPPEPIDNDFRKRMSDYIQAHGKEGLFALLKARDPETAERIHPNNTVRVIRALEIMELTGLTATAYYATQAPVTQRYDALCFLLDPVPRDYLYKRIDERVDDMIASGLVDEVRRLLPGGFSKTSLQGIGYKEMLSYLDGSASLEEVTALIKKNTRNYAKRQLTWFRNQQHVVRLSYTDSASYNEALCAMKNGIIQFCGEDFLCKNQ